MLLGARLVPLRAVPYSSSPCDKESFLARSPLPVALLLTLTGALPGSAQTPPLESPLTLQVRGVAGSSLRAKPRRFLGLNVIVENRSKQDVSGILRAYRARGPRSDTPEQSLFYERRVTIPRQGRRTENLYYYCQEDEPKDRLCVSFQPEGSEPPAPPPVFPPLDLLRSELQVLVLSSRPETLEALKRPFRQALVSGPYRVFPVVVSAGQLAALPDHMAGYEPFDAVVLGDVDPSELPADRAAALLAWVAGGGDLIVVSSGGRGKSPPSLSAALPVIHAGGQRRLRIDALQQLAPRFPWVRRPDLVLVDKVTPKPGAAVLARQGQSPLVVRGRYGGGWVTHLAFPLDAAPLRIGWRGGLQTFGAALLRPPREDPEAGQAIPPAPPLEEALLNLSEAIKTLEPPTAWIVAPLLLLYVALVSPLNFMVLSRVERLGLAQVTAAVVAVGFGLAFYGIGLLYKGTEAMVTQVALVELAAQAGELSRVEVLTGYYSTDRGLTGGSAPQDAVVGPLTGGKSSNREARVQRTADGVRLESVTLDTRIMRRFRSLRAADVGHVSARLGVINDGELSGQIHNGTQLTLQTPALLLEHGLVPLSTISPGQTLKLATSLRMSGLRAPPIPPFVKELQKDCRSRYPARYGEGLGLGIGQEPFGGSLERRVLASFQRRLARVPRLPGHLPALLVARVQSDPGGVVLEAGGEQVLERMIVLHEVQVVAPAGQYHSLRGLPPRAVGYTKEWVPTSGKTGTPPILEGADEKAPGMMTWRWQLPASDSAPLVIKRLRFQWRIKPVPTGKDHRRHVLLFGWSFRDKTWIELADLATLDHDDGKGVWPPRRDDPRVLDLVDPSSGTVVLRMSNSWINRITIAGMVLDAAFDR